MSQEILKFCDESKGLFYDTIGKLKKEGHGNFAEIDQVLCDAIARIERLECLLRATDEHIFAFVGKTNVGKSTMLNAMLGDVVAPYRNIAYSSTPVEYQHSDDGYQCIISTKGNFTKKRFQFSSAAKLLEKLKETATETGGAKSNEKIIVKLPHQLLKNNITIVDTPGYGATDGCDSSKGLHDNILLNYLDDNQRIRRVFFIVSESGIEETDKEFYFTTLKNFCTDIIVNIRSDFSAEDKQEYEYRHDSILEAGTRIHFINAKKAMNRQLDESGLADFQNWLITFTNTHGREKIAQEDLIKLYQDINTHFFEFKRYTFDWSYGALALVMDLAKSHMQAEDYQKFLNSVNRKDYL